MTRCAFPRCNRKVVWTIRNAFQSSANGKTVCDAPGHFSQFTGGYPAEGRRITPTTSR